MLHKNVKVLENHIQKLAVITSDLPELHSGTPRTHNLAQAQVEAIILYS